MGIGVGGCRCACRCEGIDGRVGNRRRIGCGRVEIRDGIDDTVTLI
jgi:hypothetical protein